MSAKFVMLANPHNNKPVLVNSDHVRTAPKALRMWSRWSWMVACIRTSIGPLWRVSDGSLPTR